MQKLLTTMSDSNAPKGNNVFFKKRFKKPLRNTTNNSGGGSTTAMNISNSPNQQSKKISNGNEMPIIIDSYGMPNGLSTQILNKINNN